MNTKSQKKANLEAVEPAQDWHPSDVIAALHKSGWTLADLGRHHGLKSGQTLSKCLTSSYPIAEERIAEVLGLHPKTIWPSRYLENGDPKPRGFKALKFNRLAGSVNAKDQGSQ